MSALRVIVIFISISFLYFGTSCLFTTYMRNEFSRYGLAKYRSTVGILQLMGGLGLTLGLCYIHWLIVVASIGLFVLMGLGVIVRIHIKDQWYHCIPALLYALLSAYVAYKSLVPF